MFGKLLRRLAPDTNQASPPTTSNNRRGPGRPRKHRGKTGNWFGPKLRYALDLQDVTVRELASRWRPDKPVAGKRAIYRYLAGDLEPGRHVRRQLARHLGVDARLLEPDAGDDGEDEQEAA
jgi:hypothetical protein